MPARDSSRRSARGSAAERGRARLAGLQRALRAHFRRGALDRFERARPRAAALLFALVPALVAGYQLAVLTLFLNRRLAAPPLLVARSTLAIGLLALPFVLLAHLAVSARRDARHARLLPWSLTVVLVAAALGDWIHASRYSFFLQPSHGANLIKLALWLSLAAILAFYTALLHTLHHRRYGTRSVMLLVLVAIGSFYVGFARLSSSRRIRPAPPPPVLRHVAPAARLAVVVVDGASLDVVLPLARQSRLPFFSTLFESGANARLATPTPVDPFVAHASFATGKLPYRSGVLGDTVATSFWLPFGDLRVVPIGFETAGLAGRGLGLDSRRPVERGDRDALALWEILAAAGDRVAVIGEPGALLPRGGLVAAASDERFRGGGEPATPPAFDGRIDLVDGRGGAPLRVEPAAREIAPVVERAIAEDRRRVAVAESLLDDDRSLALVAVALPGFADVARLTRGAFESAELEGSRGRAERAAAAALVAYAAEIDSMLLRLWTKLPETRLLAVVAPYGVDRPRGFSRAVREITRVGRLGGSLIGQPDGALWLLGAGYARGGAGVANARLVDVAPTLLYLSGIPIARDLDGRVLTEAIDPALLAKRPLTFVASYGAPPRTPGSPAPTSPIAGTTASPGGATTSAPLP